MYAVRGILVSGHVTVESLNKLPVQTSGQHSVLWVRPLVNKQTSFFGVSLALEDTVVLPPPVTISYVVAMGSKQAKYHVHLPLRVQ
jgi:hypothetical protein